MSSRMVCVGGEADAYAVDRVQRPLEGLDDGVLVGKKVADEGLERIDEEDGVNVLHEAEELEESLERRYVKRITWSIQSTRICVATTHACVKHFKESDSWIPLPWSIDKISKVNLRPTSLRLALVFGVAVVRCLQSIDDSSAQGLHLRAGIRHGLE